MDGPRDGLVVTMHCHKCNAEYRHGYRVTARGRVVYDEGLWRRREQDGVVHFDPAAGYEYFLFPSATSKTVYSLALFKSCLTHVHLGHQSFMSFIEVYNEEKVSKVEPLMLLHCKSIARSNGTRLDTTWKRKAEALIKRAGNYQKQREKLILAGEQLDFDRAEFFCPAVNCNGGEGA